jgi:hypothetical protein
VTVAPRIGESVDDLTAGLEWLDRVLTRAVARQRAEGRWRGDDDLRGIYVPPELAERVIALRGAGAALDGPPGSLPIAHGGPVDRLSERFALDEFERFALLLALAPELDSRYRTVYAYLHDDPAQTAPTIALALDLYAGAGLRSAAFRRAFAADAPLVRYRLVRPQHPVGSLSLLRVALEIDEWVIARVLGDDDLAPLEPGVRLEGLERSRPARTNIAPAVPCVVAGSDPRAALDRALELIDRPVVAADIAATPDPIELVRIAARRARADAYGLVVEVTPLPDQAEALLELVARLTADGVPAAVCTAASEVDALPDEWPRTLVADVTTRQRRARWETQLATGGFVASSVALDTVAATHPIALDRIDAAVARLAGEQPNRRLATEDLQSAARAVARHRLGGLARRVPGGRTWDELVLPPRTMRQLREISAAIEQRSFVLQEWGFGRLPNGRGLHVLFSGPSGTGKTLAASVIADEAGYALYVVDLARVVDKYLGESEKQLDRVFREATAAGAALLFDEADALFGRRAEVRDARDRYANVEVAYLLQRLESHDGVTILSTNLAHHLDQAFARRLHHRVDFAMPDVSLRRQLWEAVLPLAAPLDDDVDLGLLAERFELAGGSIRNAAVTAAYLAAPDRRAITLADLVRAIARELEKAGRPATRAEFRELHELLLAPDRAGP